MIDPDAALAYEDFVIARHRVWEARQLGLPAPWTDNPIVNERKFTNVFRILDPGTQFLMTDLYSDPDLEPVTAAYRAFLYRHTGRIETWQAAEEFLGHKPRPGDEDEILAIWDHWRNVMERPFFTNAYLVFPQSQVPGTDKVHSIVDLASSLAVSGTFQSFVDARSPQERFAVLRGVKGVGDFMAMQVTTDYGYSPFETHDQENTYVVAGPGAVKGARELEPGKVPPVLEWAHERLHSLSLELPLPGGRVRYPSLMDTQNTLCEFSKYARYMRKPLTGRAYTPAHPGHQPPPVLPTHW